MGYGGGYMCRLIGALYDGCMREYVSVLVVDGQFGETRVGRGLLG
jgi:hypothetical protein